MLYKYLKVVKNLSIIVLIAPLGLMAQEKPADSGGKSPDDTGFKINGLVRFRPEYKSNLDFDKSTDDSQEFVGQKIQLGVSRQFNKNVSVKMVVQDARVWGGQAGSATGLNTANDNTHESTDIREAWFEFKADNGFGFKAGRQILSYGDQRLVGGLDWTNVGRSFDGVNLKFEKGSFKSHLWGMVLGEEDSDIVGNNSQSTLDDAYFSGWYNTWKMNENFLADIYYLGVYKKYTLRQNPVSVAPDAWITTQDRETQRDNLHTFGIRLTNRTLKGGKKSASAIDWSAEYNYQTGENGKYVKSGPDYANAVLPLPADLFSDTNNPCRGGYDTAKGGCYLNTEKVRYDAYAFAATAGYTIDRKIRVGVEYTLGSGDPNRTDSASATFNNLYHTNHIHYGQADLTSWRNMEGKSVNITFFMGKKGNLKLAYWQIDKHKNQDAWYSVGGPAKAGASTESKANVYGQVGFLGKHLFREYDVTYVVDALGINWNAGASLVFAGDAINNAKDHNGYNMFVLGNENGVTRYKADPRASFAYLMMTYKF